MNVVEPFVRQALAFPDRPALVAGPNTLAYGELLKMVRQLGSALRAAGVGPGERVAVVVSRPAANVALTLALAAIGAVSVGVPGGLGAADLEPIMSDIGVAFVLHDRDEALAFAHPGYKGELRLQALLAAQVAPAGFERLDGRRPWRISLSSGSTGRPKGIEQSHGGTLLNVQLQKTIYPTGPEDRMLVGMGLASAFAVGYWLRCLHSGACAVLRGEPTAQEALRLLHEQPVTHFVTTPLVAMGMADAARQPGSPWASPPPALKFMTVGGAKLAPALFEGLRRHVCPTLVVSYGATEMNLIALLDPETQRHHPGSAGRLAPWVEAQAVDAEGRPLPPGQVGPLRFRTPTMALGYLGAPAQPDASAFRDGWFYSQDVGSVSPDGLVRLSGRANDVINIGGVKVDPERIESVITQDAAVHECVVVDIPGRLGKPVLVAVVVADEALDLQSVRRRVAEAGGLYVPDRVLRAQQLPHNEGGKVLRERVRSDVLRQVAAAGQAEAAQQGEPS